MNDAQDQLARAATALASHLPFSVMKSLSDAVVEYQELEWPMARTRILQAIPTPHFRDLAADFLACWKTEASEIAPQAVALVLLTSAHAEEYHRHQQVVEGVWTGPDLPDTTFRQTEPAVLEVLNGATERITLVSYAVYRIPRIRNALVQAAYRGVDITLVVETPNRLDGQNEYDCVLALCFESLGTGILRGLG